MTSLAKFKQHRLGSVVGSSKVTLVIVAVFIIIGCQSAQEDIRARDPSYHPIKEFSQKVNGRFKRFLERAESSSGRKVAVFDADGTLIGQVPHYLADEALYRYAKEFYEDEEDSLANTKMDIAQKILTGDNVGDNYITNRIHFFAGLPADSLEQWGYDVYCSFYKGRFYSGMKEVVDNLKNYGFEVWIISASPEILYQKFIADELNVDKDRIIGVRSAIVNGIISDEIIPPIPQEGGKANTIKTFIKAEPLFVAGNSRGDIEMIKESEGLKWIVNPDNRQRKQELNGVTLRGYGKQHDCIIVYSDDAPDSAYYYVSEEWNISVNVKPRPDN